MFEALVAASVILVALIGLLLTRFWNKSNARQPIEYTEEATSVPPTEQLEKLKKSPLFSGVAVEPHCGAASGLAGKKYPLAQAPQIPVPGCDARSCSCRYIGLAERRRGNERRRHADRRVALRMESNRRSGRFRRLSDEAAWTDQYSQ